MYYNHLHIPPISAGDRRGRDSMVDGFTTTYQSVSITTDVVSLNLKSGVKHHKPQTTYVVRSVKPFYFTILSLK
jgi:hypothetical protein